MDKLNLVIEAARLHTLASRLVKDEEFSKVEREKVRFLHATIASEIMKESKSTTVAKIQKLLKEYVGLSSSLSFDIASSVVRRNRDLASLAVQKGWAVDGTSLAIGCEKMRQAGVSSRYGWVIDCLERFAGSLGVDEEMLADYEMTSLTGS